MARGCCWWRTAAARPPTAWARPPLITNIVPVTSSGSGSPSTTTINLAMDTGTLAINYNFYTIPDEMVV